MAEDRPAGSLPTELIDEKTFYTLGGASAAVLLVCWAINYIAVDAVSYKAFRLIGILLSELFAILIVLKAKKKSSARWLFAFLNGILIFINASGLNTMTSSYIFDAKDSTQREIPYLQHAGDGSFQQAGLFTLPRMKSWWPDEKLVEQNQHLAEKTNVLDSVNYQLRVYIQNFENNNAAKSNGENDSLRNIIASLQQQISDKQHQVELLTSSLHSSESQLRQQLADCIRSNAGKKDSLNNCQTANTNLRNENNNFQQRLNNCNTLLARCNADKTSTTQPTLAELLRQVCSRVSPDRRVTLDDDLRQQQFFKDMNWPVFCRRFNTWYNERPK